MVYHGKSQSEIDDNYGVPPRLRKPQNGPFDVINGLGEVDGLVTQSPSAQVELLIRKAIQGEGIS